MSDLNLSPFRDEQVLPLQHQNQAAKRQTWLLARVVMTVSCSFAQGCPKETLLQERLMILACDSASDAKLRKLCESM